MCKENSNNDTNKDYVYIVKRVEHPCRSLIRMGKEEAEREAGGTIFFSCVHREAKGGGHSLLSSYIST